MMVKDYDTCTDEELIARLRAGEREITDYLIDKYKSLVWNKLLFVLEIFFSRHIL